MRKILKLATIALLATSCFGQNVPDYRNPKLPIPDRVADLLKRMTIEEKVDQLAGGRRRMMTTTDPEGQRIFGQFREVFKVESQISPHDAAELRNDAQKYLLEKTRLGIPAIFQGEPLHGYMAYGSTSFYCTVIVCTTLTVTPLEFVA